MSRFLHFLLAAYAPLAARHLLVERVSTRPVAGRAARAASARDVAQRVRGVDIGSEGRCTADACDDLSSLAV
jgi:hypothetical protein